MKKIKLCLAWAIVAAMGLSIVATIWMVAGQNAAVVLLSIATFTALGTWAVKTIGEND